MTVNTNSPVFDTVDPSALSEFVSQEADFLKGIGEEYQPVYDEVEETPTGAEATGIDDDQGDEETQHAASAATSPSLSGGESRTEPPKEDPAVTRGFEQLVKRETEVALRERDLVQASRRVAEIEQENRRLRDQLGQQTNLRDQFEMDPEAALKQLAVDPERFMAVMTARRLGDKAPPELRAALKDADDKRRFRELEDRIAQRDRQDDAVAHQARVSGEIRAYVTGEASKHAPHVAALSKVDAAAAEREVLEEIARDAQVRLTRGERHDAPALPYQEAVNRVNARLDAYYKALTPPPAGSTPAASTTTQSTTASTGNQQKPPAKQKKPLRPWESSEFHDQEERALREAVAEYRSVQSARRK